MVYYQLSLDRKIKQAWKKHKECKKLKRNVLFSSPVNNILSHILRKFRRIKTLDCVYVEYKILNILDEVIGNDYFGTSQNRKRFYYLVNKITTQSRFECVYLSALSKGYNTEAMHWLQHESLSEIASRKILQNTNLFLLKYIVKPLIKHFYHPLKNYKGYEIKFVERPTWHSFQHKVLNELLQLKYLIPVNNNKHSSRGELKLFPKKSCDSLEYRPIIYPLKYNSIAKARFKRLSTAIENLANKLSRIGNAALFLSWKKYCRFIGDKHIYGIKLDIRDAFGYVNVDKLCSIIKLSNFRPSDKQFIINHVQHQYVTFHKKMFRWNHGLLQGDCLSPSLCNLYMSNFENEHLKEFIKADCFLHRKVDDYYFCSSQKADVHTFEVIIKSGFQINDTKTERTGNNNFTLSYCGQVFDLNSKQVSKYFHFKKRWPIRHNFKLWNIKSIVPEKSKKHIIIKALQFPSNNHCFLKLELNTSFNSEEIVLKNYFVGMVFIAFKFDAAVMAIKEYKEEADDMPFLTSVLENIVSQYSKIVFSKIQKNLGKYFTKNITFTLLKNIAYRAFIVVLKKRNEFYKNIISFIKNKNLYLKLETFCIKPSEFNILPQVFDNICMNRVSNI